MVTPEHIIPIPIPGYMKASELEVILKYIEEGRASNISWDEWQKTFKSTW